MVSRFRLIRFHLLSDVISVGDFLFGFNAHAFPNPSPLLVRKLDLWPVTLRWISSPSNVYDDDDDGTHYKRFTVLLSFLIRFSFHMRELYRHASFP